MSDPKKVKLHTIPVDSLVTLEVSGEFHKRLVGAYFNYVSKIETEKFEEIADYMSKGELNKLTGQQLVDATSLQTLLIIISNLEKLFIDGGFDKEQEFEMPTED